MRLLFILSILISLSPITTIAQHDADPCGHSHLKTGSDDGWGYGYDTLVKDVKRWSESEYCTKSVLGKSVQNRDLWMVEITDYDYDSDKKRVWIHSRTHPGEFQSSKVVSEIIELLLSDKEAIQQIREEVVFNILPMLNPDGVELGNSRENANMIDIESNWNADEPEAEVAVLKKTFEEYMRSDMPFSVALNVHSAYACKRYFVFHHANGTSDEFAVQQKDFIASVQSHMDGEMEDWDYFVSWTSGTPPKYPESWYWNNHQEDVLALTYEDMNCSSAGDYDKTALALVNGTYDFLNGNAPVGGLDISDNVSLFPSAAQSGEFVTVKAVGIKSVQLFNIKGQDVNISLENDGFIVPQNITPGIYFVKVISSATVINTKLIVN